MYTQKKQNSYSMHVLSLSVNQHHKTVDIGGTISMLVFFSYAHTLNTPLMIALNIENEEDLPLQIPAINVIRITFVPN